MRLSKSIFGPLAVGFALLGLVGLGVLVLGFVRRQHTVSSNTSSPSPAVEARSTTVDARQVWTDSTIQINKGDVVTIDATGQVNVAAPGDGADKWVSPEGWGYIPLMQCGTQPCRYVYRTPDSMGCLIGKIDDAKAFKIGRHYEMTAPISGRLFLSVNDAMSSRDGTLLDDSRAAALMFSDNRGSFNAVIRIQESRKSAAYGENSKRNSGPSIAVGLPQNADGSYTLSGTREGWAPLGQGTFTIEVKGSIDFGGFLASPDRSPIMGNQEALVPGVPFGVPVGKISDHGKPFMIGYSHQFQSGDQIAYIAVNDSYYADNKGSYIIYKR